MDETILLFINGHHCGYFDAFMTMLTHRFTWIPMYVVLAWCIVRTLGWKKALAFIVAVGLTIVLADQVGASLIRPWAVRLRPSNLDNPLSQLIHVVNDYRGGSYGMPSCHAANTMALLTIVLMRFRSRLLAGTMTVWMLSQVYSRMYLGVHYPTDILAGMAVGGCSALVVYMLYRCVTKDRDRDEALFVPFTAAFVAILAVIAVAAAF